MKKNDLTICLLCIAVSSLLLAGCGGEPLGTVTGTATLDGEPIANGSIVFEVPGARSASGKIVDGQIVEVMTFEANDGVPVGEAKIAVRVTEAPAGGEDEADAPVAANPGESVQSDNYMGMNDVSLISPHYNDPAESGLTCTIVKGENVVTIELTSE